MALRFYMDVHVPAAITQGLRRRGVDALTSQEDGTRQAHDEELLARATEVDRLLVTQDEAFLKLAAQWQKTDRAFTGVIFAPQEGGSIGRYIDDLELISACCREVELRNSVQHLPLK
jgi:hypothetical protein